MISLEIGTEKAITVGQQTIKSRVVEPYMIIITLLLSLILFLNSSFGRP